ncbi:hypothetical protein J3R83DRAFT_3075 [Lanmaoa asiatica]|nr:hypothetical protein J3R83DRAFT_3075 [Lanmaoa asiatica]
MNLNTFRVLGIDNLYLVLGDFFSSQSYTSRNGCHCTVLGCPLPFSSLHVWNQFCVQL